MLMGNFFTSRSVFACYKYQYRSGTLTALVAVGRNRDKEPAKLVNGSICYADLTFRSWICQRLSIGTYLRFGSPVYT